MIDDRSRTARSAVIVMLSMIISRILGFVRDIIIANQYGQSYQTDAYNLAFVIPDAIYMILVGGAFSAAFIPVFSSYVAKKQEKTAWEVASVTMSVICVCMVVLVSLAYVFAPQLVDFFFKFNDAEFAAEKYSLTTVMTRVMLFQVVFMALAGISSGVLQSYKKFGPTAYGGVAYNVGIIVVGATFGGIIESRFPGYGIVSFAIGVVTGALANLLIQFFSLRKVGMHYRFSLNIRHPGFKKVMLLMLPVLIGLSASELNLVINMSLASGLDTGLASALKMAQRFMQLPISIFAISIAMTLFPVLTQEAAQGRMKEYRRDYAGGIRSILFICIPCSVLLAVLAVPFIRLLYLSGEFTMTAVHNTAFALYFYVIGIFAQGCIHLTSRAFYALQNTVLPVAMAVIGVLANILFSLLLVRVLAQGGLALAYSIGGIVNLALLFIALRRKISYIHGREIFRSALQTLGISVIMGGAAWLFAAGSEWIFGVEAKWAQAVQLVGAGIVGCIVFLVLAKWLRMPEVESFLNSMRRRFKSNPKPQ